MSRLVLFVLVTALATISIAGARENTANMSCDEAAATVARAGAIVLSTGVNTYDRFVADISHCMPRQTTEPALAPTLDSRFCQVGFICRGQDWFNDDDH
jgi:hypothetical protein